MNPDLPWLYDLKTLAKTMRAARAMTHSQALEQIAKRYGFRNWNTLKAAAGPQPPIRVGQSVSGHYLQVPFTGIVLWIKSEKAGLFRVNIEFDELIDVVSFSSFSNLKNRANKVIDTKGVSIDKTSNGNPHMALTLS